MKSHELRSKAFDSLMLDIAFSKQLMSDLMNKESKQSIKNTINKKIKCLHELEKNIQSAMTQLTNHQNKLDEIVSLSMTESNKKIEHFNQQAKDICDKNNHDIDKFFKAVSSLMSIKATNEADKNDMMVAELISESEIFIQSCYLNTPVLTRKLTETRVPYTAKDLYRSSQSSNYTGTFYARSQIRHSVNKISGKFESVNKFGDKNAASDLIKDSKNINASNTTRKKYHNIGAGNSDLPVSDFKINENYTSSKLRSFSSHKNHKKLRDGILSHKNNAVKKLIDLTKDDKYQKFLINKQQVNAKYPCLVILFSAFDRKNESNHGLKPGYQEFATHLLIACINQQLKNTCGGPLIERRESFGFMTPTLSDIQSGLRLSLGLVPNNDWLVAVRSGIKNCDLLLSKLPMDFNCDEYDSHNNHVMMSVGHRIMLGEMEASKIPSEIVDRLSGLHSKYNPVDYNHKNKINKKNTK